MMIYKKIILKPSSGLITPLESDTILSYIFAYNFEKLNEVYRKFCEGKDLPFVLTNGFSEGILPKPMYFNDKLKPNETSLEEDILNEVDKKKKKKLSNFPIKKDYFEMIFEGDNFEKYEDLISEYLKKDEVKIIVEIDAKNTIPRFNIGETTPYEIGNVKYTNGIFVIYVKIFDEISFNSFFECLKNTFESIGFGKAKGRGYGHFENIKLENLVDEEIKVFEYFEKLRRERGLYFILNNYKPTDEEIDNMDLNKSYYKINLKHTKTLSELEKNVFKGQMNFFSEGSVIFSAEKLIGNFYKFENSYNFGYIF